MTEPTASQLAALRAPQSGAIEPTEPPEPATTAGAINPGNSASAATTAPTTPTKTAKLSAADKHALFISFEGGEGVGKSTQIAYLAEELEFRGLTVRTIREPGDTRIGEQIRAILLDPANTSLEPESELFLYEAARVQMVKERLLPLLCDRGVDVVLCDRFYDSTYAYQGFGRGLNLELIDWMNQVVSFGVVPDRTLVLVNDVRYALAKATKIAADRIEAQDLAFHERVLDGFLHLAQAQPERLRVIHSLPDKRDTAELVLSAVEDLL
jgi:dTMP kinase